MIWAPPTFPPGTRREHCPLPARMTIDTDGIIRYAAINADYTVQPDPVETIAALKRIV